MYYDFYEERVKWIKFRIREFREKQRLLVKHLSDRAERDLTSNRTSYDFRISSYTFDDCHTRLPKGTGLYDLFEADFSTIYKEWESNYIGREDNKMRSWLNEIRLLWGEVEYTPNFTQVGLQL